MSDIGYSASMSKPMTLTEKKLIAMSPEMVDAIREFRFANRIETESQAIRQLIHTGLAARPILLDVQKMLVSLRPVGGESDLDRHIEAIQAALGHK
jgi:hypothetical protein